MQLKYLGLVVLAVFTVVGMSEAFAQEYSDNAPQESSIVVTTDKSSYSEGETIVIAGQVRDVYSGTPVSVIVKAPNGNLVSIAKIKVDTNKKFSTEMTAGGALMKSEGAYIVTAQYGTANRSAETTFEFGGAATTPPGQDESLVSDTMVKMGDGNGSIGYDITGGQLLSITPDVDANSLIVGIDATSDGSLTLTIPRSVIDASFETGEDEKFFVLIDGEEVDFSEDASSTDRTLTIAFQAGAEEIEIIGTSITFGTPYTPTNSDNHKETNENLKETIRDLKHENRDLKQKITNLNNEIDELQDLLINGLKEIYNWKSNNS